MGLADVAAVQGEIPPGGGHGRARNAGDTVVPELRHQMVEPLRIVGGADRPVVGFGRIEQGEVADRERELAAVPVPRAAAPGDDRLGPDGWHGASGAAAHLVDAHQSPVGGAPGAALGLDQEGRIKAVLLDRRGREMGVGEDGAQRPIGAATTDQGIGIPALHRRLEGRAGRCRQPRSRAGKGAGGLDPLDHGIRLHRVPSS